MVVLPMKLLNHLEVMLLVVALRLVGVNCDEQVVQGDLEVAFVGFLSLLKLALLGSLRCGCVSSCAAYSLV